MLDVLHPLAAFLLALVGYSAGAVVAGGGRDVRPSVWELPVAAGIAVGAATRGDALVGGWLTLPVALAAGAATGLAAGLVSRTLRRRRAPQSSRDAHVPRPGESENSAVRRFLLRLGNFQGQLTLGFLYFVLLAPFALVSRLTGSPLSLAEDRATYWRDRDDGASGDPTESLRRQA